MLEEQCGAQARRPSGRLILYNAAINACEQLAPSRISFIQISNQKASGRKSFGISFVMED